MIWSMPGQQSMTSFMDAKAFQNTEHEARQHGAGQRAHAADNNHNELKHKKVHAHVIVGRVDRRVHHTRQTRHRGREAEHDRKALVDVDAEQANGFAVGHTSPHNHPEGGELQEGKDSSDNEHREEEVDQAPVRVDDRIGIKPKHTPKSKLPTKRQGQGLGSGWRRKVRFDDLFDNDGKAKGHKNLVRVWALVEVLDQAALHDEADENMNGIAKRMASGTDQS